MKDRLRARLAARPPERLSIPGFGEAAVLVPIVRRGLLTVLVFTARPSGMPTHGGQISMPGGRRAAGDPDLCATALREAAEELGIPPSSVEVLGRLDDVATPSGFVITPVVGWLEDPAPFRPDPREVDEVFELDLASLPAVHRDIGEREVGGRTYRLHEYRAGGRVIWGATARVVYQLLDLVPDPPCGPAARAS